jgi:uncharacterized protein YeaO (DUF488 family)
MEEQILIQKLMYKEIYREDALMWMDLWEKEFTNSNYLANAVKIQNEKLLISDAKYTKEQELRKYYQDKSNMLLDDNKSLHKQITNKKIIIRVGIPLVAVAGIYLGTKLDN